MPKKVNDICLLLQKLTDLTDCWVCLYLIYAVLWKAAVCPFDFLGFLMLPTEQKIHYQFELIKVEIWKLWKYLNPHFKTITGRGTESSFRGCATGEEAQDWAWEILTMPPKPHCMNKCMSVNFHEANEEVNCLKTETKNFLLK